MKSLKNIKNSHEETNRIRSLNKRIGKLHKEDLGLETPEDYFFSSKKELLERISMEKPVKSSYHFRKKLFLSTAAVIIFLITLNLFNRDVSLRIDETTKIVLDTIDELKSNEVLTEQHFEKKENDVLIASLFVDDNEIEQFIDSYVMEGSVYGENFSD